MSRIMHAAQASRPDDRNKADRWSLAWRSTMNLKISGHHLEVTPAIREYVVTKLDRVLRHSDQVIDGTVILSVDNLSLIHI